MRNEVIPITVAMLLSCSGVVSPASSHHANDLIVITAQKRDQSLKRPVFRGRKLRRARVQPGKATAPRRLRRHLRRINRWP